MHRSAQLSLLPSPRSPRVLAGGAPPTRAGATCSTRPRRRAARRARPAQRARARRQAPRRGRPARATCCTRTTPASSWQQADVPVSSDLVAVPFPTPTHGWAVGHDGVVLHSADAGAHLDAPARRPQRRQADGRVLRARAPRRVDAEARRGAARGGQAPRGAGRREPVPRRLVPRRSERLRRRRLQPDPAHRATAARPGSRWLARDRQPEGPAPLRDARHRRRALHRRRAGPACSSSTRDGERFARSSCRTRARCSA